MHSTIIHLLFFFSVIKASWQINVSFANDPNQQYHMRQVCINLPPAICCVPLDVSIDRLGWGWFRAKHLLFQDLPRYNVHLAAFRYQRPRSDCDGELVLQHRTVGEALDAYTDHSPEGYSGSLYVPQAVSNGNKTGVISEAVQRPSARIQYPDVIHYQGVAYNKRGDGSLIYSSVDGKTISGAPLFGMSITSGAKTEVLVVIVNTVAGRLTGLGANGPEDMSITTL